MRVCESFGPYPSCFCSAQLAREGQYVNQTPSLKHVISHGSFSLAKVLLYVCKAFHQSPYDTYFKAELIIGLIINSYEVKKIQSQLILAKLKSHVIE